jgi:hypothetical protein
MKIDLSPFEIELLDKALDAYEAQPSSSGFIGALLGAAILRDEQKAEEFMRKQQTEAERVTKQRRMKVALLRAKLLQAVAIDSEHSLEENPFTPPGGK